MTSYLLDVIFCLGASDSPCGSSSTGRPFILLFSLSSILAIIACPLVSKDHHLFVYIDRTAEWFTVSLTVN